MIPDVTAKCDKCGNFTECEEICDMGGTFHICPVCRSEKLAAPPVPPETKVYQLSVLDLSSPTQHLIAKTVIELGRSLLEKNQRHGDSAFKPVSVHSDASPTERLKIQADEKLALLRTTEDPQALINYIGFLVLLYTTTSRT